MSGRPEHELRDNRPLSLGAKFTLGRIKTFVFALNSRLCEASRAKTKLLILLRLNMATWGFWCARFFTVVVTENVYFFNHFKVKKKYIFLNLLFEPHGKRLLVTNRITTMCWVLYPFLKS